MRVCVRACTYVLGDVQGCAFWGLTSEFRGPRPRTRDCDSAVVRLIGEEFFFLFLSRPMVGSRLICYQLAERCGSLYLNGMGLCYSFDQF